MTCTASGLVTSGQYSNVGTANGTGPAAQQVSDTDPSHYFGSAPDIDVEKYVSVNGGTWLDADDAPGPTVPSDANVSFKFVVTNTGNVPLEDVDLDDTDFDLSVCGAEIVDPLPVLGSFECVIGPFDANMGQHTNEATASGNGFPLGEYVEDKDEAHYYGVLPSLLTNSSLCTFDVDGVDENGRQFKLLYTQNAESFPEYELRASNPGQFYYNVVHCGVWENGSLVVPDVVVDLTTAYPFITQGAMAVHAYNGVTYCEYGSTYPECEGVEIPEGETCLLPGAELGAYPRVVTLQDYMDAGTDGYVEPDPGSGIWFAQQMTLDSITVPYPGGPGEAACVYVNIHLDYGLKDKDIDGDGEPEFHAKDSNDNALFSGTFDISIPNNATHEFSFYAVDGGMSGDDDSVHNLNTFKKNPGVGGLVTFGANPSVGEPAEGAIVELYRVYDDGDQFVGYTVTADVDGYYQIVYKHKGKKATYKVVAEYGGMTMEAYFELKANKFSQQDFFFDTSGP
jgi:hypothetical protein